MSRWRTITFQFSIMSKVLAKHISTKVSFKFIIRNWHVYIAIGWPWIWNQYFYLGIRNYDRTKLIVLPSFLLVTRINSQNRSETEVINELLHINFIWILVFPIGIIEVSTPKLWSFLHYFSSLQHFWPPSNWYSLVHTSWGEMERCEQRAFQLLKMRKKKISWNLKTKCITDFVFTVRPSRMKDYTCH